MDSKHLNEIMDKQERNANMQVVFIDIEKYSKRRTSAQVLVIDNFTKLIDESLKIISKEYRAYAKKNSKDFYSDLIILPTGDGLAIAFSFNGLNDIHLFFAKTLLSLVHKLNSKTKCEKFVSDGWCNCHNYMNLRIGISEGKAIVYRDIIGKYNIAGNVINMASRVMNLIDRNQIAFTQTAYEQIVDMIEDPNFATQFKEFINISIKHGEKIKIYQYLGDIKENYINKNAPEKLELYLRSDTVLKKLENSGITFPDREILEDNPKAAIEMMENIGDSFQKMIQRSKEIAKSSKK